MCIVQVGSIDLVLLATYANKDLAATISDEIDYLYTITNDGLLTLYNIAVQAEALMTIVCVDTDGQDVAGSNLGNVEGLASYPDNGLAPAEFLTCRATGSVSRAEVRDKKIHEPEGMFQEQTKGLRKRYMDVCVEDCPQGVGTKPIQLID